MDDNGYRGPGSVGGRGQPFDAQSAQHAASRAQQRAELGDQQFRMDDQQAARGPPVVRPVARPIPRPVARDPVPTGAQQAIGARRPPGPGEPVRIPNLRGPRRPSNGDNGAAPSGHHRRNSSPPPRPPRSSPTPPPPALPAVFPLPPGQTQAQSPVLMADEPFQEPTPDNSVHSSTAVSSDKQKQVLFADKHRSMSEKYTFYREPTPPPLPRPAMFAADLGNGPVLGDSPPRGNGPPFNANGDYYDYKYDHVAPQAPIPHSDKTTTILGLRKRIFWIVLAAVLLVIVLAVGIGVGVGVGNKKSSSDSTSDAQNAPNSDSTATATRTSTVTSGPTSTTAATTSLPIATNTIACPGANDTEYKIPGSPKKFRRFCGIDHDPTQGDDIGSVWTATMEDCMINCAGFPGCTACGWGAIRGDPGSDHRCWLKNDLTSSHQDRTGWQFAVLE